MILEQAAKFGMAFGSIHFLVGEKARIFFRFQDLTSHKYLWLVTQSVIGDPEDRSTMRMSLPIGMLGIYLRHLRFRKTNPFKISLINCILFHDFKTLTLNQGLSLSLSHKSFIQRFQDLRFATMFSNLYFYFQLST
jgi:hypothetical protein